MKKGSQGIIVFKNAQLELAKEPVKDAIGKLRKKWKIPVDGFQKYKDYKNWLDSLTRKKVFATNKSPSIYSGFLQDIANTLLPIIDKPYYWIYFFVLYITKGIIKDKIVLRSGNTPVTPKLKVLSVNGKSKLILELNANTKLNDIKKVWPKAKFILKSFPDYESARSRSRLLDDLTLLKELNDKGSVKKIYNPHSIPDDAEDVRTPEASHKALQRLKKAIKGH